MPKGKGTCPLAQSFWKDQVTTVCHVHPSLQLSAKEARGLLQQKRGEHDTPAAFKATCNKRQRGRAGGESWMP